MTVVSLNGALGLVRQLAKQATSDEEQLDDYQSEGAEWIRSVFYCVSRNGEAVESWSSISENSVVQTADSYRYFVVELKNATAQYVNQMQWLHCPAFNWLLANLLVHAEVSATSVALGFSDRWIGGKFSWKILLAQAAGVVVAWSIWLAVVVALLIFELPWLAAGWIVLTILSQFVSWRKKRRRLAIMTSMLAAYGSLDSMALSWTIVWDALRKSRDDGAVWPPELYQHVERLKVA
ncbi:hypothetical protein DT603_08190 [Pseudoxanthomonas gei]|uniref:Uncharacterized protein n=1 Tax=Pseudoxanthomonas gei TaxID=1383030 RepID=A0ABX0AH30_9GAMM|nr:hypothetical protein [Pseudoxanthomonas gei]NDK38816.1 hypothetical protein [Pseudoxanthomonas gei]